MLLKIILLGVLTLYQYVVSLFITNNFLALKSAMHEINTVIITSLWLVFVWYLYPFMANLYVSLYLKWVSCSNIQLGHCVLTHSRSLCLLIGVFRHRCLKWLLRINIYHICHYFLFVAFVLPLLLFSTLFLPFVVLTEYLLWFHFSP